MHFLSFDVRDLAFGSIEFVKLSPEFGPGVWASYMQRDMWAVEYRHAG